MNSKRLYLGLSVASLAVIGLVYIVVYNLIRLQDRPVFHGITIGLSAVFIALFLVAAAGMAAMFYAIVRAQKLPSLEGSMRMATSLLFPVAVQLGMAVGIARERTWGSFIEVNNFLVRTQQKYASRGKVVLLAPHCLQESDCPVKITHDINNCRRCGKCDISGLIEVAGKYGAILRVATGGTLARKIIREIRPIGIIAIACERDLSLGIQDATPLPVMGVLNLRPNGPCRDTRVDIGKVEEALKSMIRGG